MGLKQDTIVGGNVTTAKELKVYVKGELEKYMDDNEDKKCDAKDEDEPHGWKKHSSCYIYSLLEVDIRNLRLYEKDNDNKSVQITNDNQVLDANKVYAVLEVHKVLPVDLLRTVKITQLVPAVYTVKANFTDLSPIYCASFSMNEQGDALQWKEKIHNKGTRFEPKISGVSLRCWKKELETTLSDGNPLEDTALESLVDGNYSVSLKSLVNLTDPTGLGNYRNSNFEEMGITLSSLSTIVDLAPEYILSKWKEPSQVKTKNKLCKFYYRYVLDRGTDLTAHGMAVVVDNSSPGHCSLIADKDFTTSGPWKYIGPGKRILWPPKHPVNKEAWKDIVDEQNPDDQRIEYTCYCVRKRHGR